MRRVCIVASTVVVLVAGLGNPASAGERQRTRTVHYTGFNEVNFFVGSTGDGTGAAFTAASWAQSIRVSVRDDLDTPVAYKVRFNRPAFASGSFPHGCGESPHPFALPSGTKRVFVQTEIPLGCSVAHPVSVATTGVIKVTFSSRAV